MSSTKPIPHLFRRLTAMMGAAALVLLTLVAGVVKAPAAQAAEALSCSPNLIYGQDNNGNIRPVTVNPFATIGSNIVTGQRANGLAISDGGQYVFTVDNNNANAKSLRMWDVVGNQQVKDVPVTGFGTNYLFKGAVNPANGYYYFAGYTQVGVYIPGEDSAYRIGSFTGTNVSGNTGNGDIAFGADGTLYVLIEGTVYKYSGTLPTTSGNQNFALTKVVDLASAPSAPNGIAFGNGGKMYISAGNSIYEYDLSTGTQVKSQNLGFAFSDLGSCSYASTLSLTVNLPEGRFADTDQFGMFISGSNDADNAATTTGSGSNTGGALAGPVFTDAGNPYGLQISPAGTANLTNYNSSIACSYSKDGQDIPVEVGGTAPDWNITYLEGALGSDVQCVATLTPRLPGLELNKTSNPAPGAGVKAGQTINYTVTAKNTGSTKLDPVNVSDDLSGVLDVATFNNDAVLTVTAADNSTVSTEGITIDANKLAWAGSLDPGHTATLTYSVKVNADAKTGTLKNVATAKGTPPTGEPLEPEPKETEHPVVNPGFEITKSADPASGTTVKAGDTVTYTLTAKNTGNVALNPATLNDDLAGVLGNATYNGDASATAGTVSVSGNTLSWSGALAAGEQSTITYSVTVNEGAQGVALENLLTGSGTPQIPTGDPNEPTQPGEPIVPEEQKTTHPLNDPQFTLTKVSDPASATLVAPGHEITYTVTGANPGNRDLTNVKINDDLSAILQNADLVGSPTATIGTATITDGKLSWSGDLNVDASVVITYKVKVKDSVTGAFLENTVNGEATPLLPNPDDPDNPIPGEPITPPEQGTFHPLNDPGFEIEKTSNPVSDTKVMPNGVITYSLSGKNTGNLTLDPVVLTDDLSDVLVNATYAGGATAIISGVGLPVSASSGLTYDAAAKSLTWTGALKPGETVVVVYTVQMNSFTTMPDVAFIANTLSGEATPQIPLDPEDPDVTEPGAKITPEPTGTEHPIVVPCLCLDKVADPASGTAVNPGEEITYTVTATNSRDNADLVDVTVTDDLSAVLAYADIVGTPTSTGGTGTLTFDASAKKIVWTGEIPLGEVVEITYTVKVKDDAPAALLKNTVVGTGTPSVDGVPGNPVTPPSVSTQHPVVNPSFTVEKQADPTSGSKVMPNGTVKYTVVGANTGNTVLSPFTLTDDLSEVLVNASYNDDAAAVLVDEGGNRSVPATAPVFDAASGTLVWADALKPGESIELTYSVKINSYTALPTANTITNTVVGAATPLIPKDPSNPNSPTTPGEPLEPVEESTTHELVVPCLCIDKASDPASGTAVAPGEGVTYTVTATNARDDADLVNVTVTDDLSDVLDYATLVPGSIRAEGATGSHTFDAATGVITWKGTILQGEVLKLTYTVQVNEDGSPGLLHNTAKGEGYVRYGEEVLPDPIRPPAVETSHPVVDPGFTVTKVADPASGEAVQPGYEVTYMVTGTNTGDTVLNPATITDDLTGVLANATLVADPVANKGALVLDGNLIKWSGTLAVGESVEIIYAVKVKEDASNVWLNNTAEGVATPLVPTDPTKPGSPTKPGEPIPADPVETSHPVVSPAFNVTKGANPASGTAVNPAGEITYTVTGVNAGDTKLADVKIEDDLTDVLAHATLVVQPTADKPGTVKVTGNLLTWVGDLDKGQSVTITYTVKVSGAAAGKTLHNVVVGEATPLIPVDPEGTQTRPGEPLEAGPVETEHPVNTPGFDLQKSVSPVAGTAVDPGAVLTYTVTGTNSGQTPLDPVVIEDDLAAVLNHATYNGDAAATVDGTMSVAGNQLRWVGALAPGQSVKITYSVTVNGDAVGMNLENVVSAVATPPGGPKFNLTPPPRETNNPVNVPGLSTSKAADPVAGTAVDPGQVIQYTVTAKNTGQMKLNPALVTDNLADVLAHATYNDDAAANVAGDIKLDGTELTWNGVLEAGEEVTLTYSVTVNADAGGETLKNAAWGKGTPPGGATPLETPESITTHYVNKPALELEKTVDARDGAAVDPGTVLTYTVKASNTGETALNPVIVTDDLSGVLSHAAYNGDAQAQIAGVDAGTVSVVGNTLTWEGALAVGESVELTYSVTVGSSAAGKELVNLAGASGTPPGGDTHKVTPPPVEVANPVNTPGMNLTKVATPRSGTSVKGGETIKYTVTATNTGQTDLTEMTVSDDLAKVLPYATYNKDAKATVSGAPVSGLEVTGSSLTWKGDLKVGEAVTITYSVKVKSGVEGKVIENLATASAVAPAGEKLTSDPVTTKHTVKSALAVTGARSLPMLLIGSLGLLGIGYVAMTRGRGTRKA